MGENNKHRVENLSSAGKAVLSKISSELTGAPWVAQWVQHPTSAQVTISWFVGSSPALGLVLTAQSLEPASDSVSLSVSLCPSSAHALSLSFSFKNKQKKKIRALVLVLQ